MGGFSIWHWLIVLLVVVLIFGTKKLANIGKDVGGAVKGFKDAMNDEKAVAEASIMNTLQNAAPPLIEGEVVEVPVKVAATTKAPAKKPATKTAAAKPATKVKVATTTKAKTETVKPKAPTKKPTAKKPAVKKPAATKPKAASTTKA